MFLVNVDPTVVDTRIIQESLSTGFSLKLPLSLYDVTTDTVIEELGKRRIDRNGTTGLNKLIGSADPNVLASLKKALFGTIGPGTTGGGGLGSNTPPSPGGSPAAGGTAPATPAASASQAMGQASQSPKMSRLMGNKSNVSTGYYGPFTFLDNQGVFDEVFGREPVILSSFPLQKSTIVKEQIEEFVDACKFDVFISSCRNYYVGMNSKESDTQATHAACKTINGLRMEYRANGRMMTDNPDVLFGKFMDVTPLLPDDASKWSTQLCTAYFNGLTEELRARMENDSFIMPSLKLSISRKSRLMLYRLYERKHLQLTRD